MSFNISSWQSDGRSFFVLSLPLNLNLFIELLICLWLPSWQQEIIMISAHQCLIISLNIPQCCNIFKPYVWSNKDQNAHHHLHKHTHTHTHFVILCHTSKTIYSSANRWHSGKERESWKQSRHSGCNLRVSRQRFPVDLWTAKGNPSPFCLVLFKHKSNYFFNSLSGFIGSFLFKFLFVCFVTFLFLIIVFYCVKPWLLIESFHFFRTGFGPM